MSGKVTWHDALNMPTLAYRRQRGDMIEVFKILSDKGYDRAVRDFLPLSQNTNTRGNSLKLEH